MKMSNEIYLRCNLCDDAHSYQLNHHVIIAINTVWKSDVEGEYLLSNQPEPNSEYEVIIHGPLKLNLRDNFWSIYRSPNATLNGFENEADVASIRFCLNSPLEIVSSDANTVNLKVKVIKLVEMASSTSFDNPQVSWMNLLENHSASGNYYQIENFFRYSLININIQSDLGLVLIVEKNDNQSWIVAANEWDFHKNLWYAYSKKFSKEEEVKYGIVHIAEMPNLHL